jgi:hypothetical protein
MTRSGTRLFLVTTAASCAAFLLFLPRAIEPAELPALVLDPRASAAALEDDARSRRLDGIEGELARAADDGERALDAALASDARRMNRELAAATHHGLVRGGRRLAPRIVVRAFAKVRWNASRRRAEDDGLAPIERQAYYGWLALEAPDLSPELRALSLEAHAAAGGGGRDEALALLHAVRGHHGDAFLRYAALFRDTGELRYRNHARWAALAMH